MRCQLQDFRVIDNCDGNKEDFVKMIAALNQENVGTYADIVVNHMAKKEMLQLHSQEKRLSNNTLITQLILFADECSLLWRREEDGIVGINIMSG